MDRTKKRREQRWRQSERAMAIQWLENSPDIMDALAGIDHPKIKADEHSMLSYVYWLINHNHIAKAKEIAYAYTSSN
jgi:hypothetical protein